VVCFPVTVSGVGVINNANGLNKVLININHPYTGDLNVRLKSPDGTIIPLALQDVGTTQTNFTNTTFIMTAGTAINGATADNPYTGNFRPQGNLGWFNNGQNANGVWNLCVEDIAATDVGNVVNFSITFNNTPATLPVIAGCAGNASAGDQCSTSTPICNLNGYCGNTSALYSPNYWNELYVEFDNCLTGGALGSSIENNSFIKFVASAATVNLNVNVTNSVNGLGVQFFAFSGSCGSGAVTSHGCGVMTPGTNTFTATGLTPGNTYFLMIDGFSGDVCDYTVTVTSGVNVFTITPAAPTICTGGAGVALTATGGNGTYAWSPATGLSATSGATVTATPGSTQTYTVTTGAIGSLNCPLSKTVTVTVTPPPSVTAPASVCVGNTATLSPTTGGTWVSSNNAIATVTNAGVITGVSTGPVTFTFTTAAGCSATTTSVNVTPSVTPTFVAVAPFCSGTVAPILPTTSTNGITGTWSPATVNNTTSGTYTFTPTAGQCASITTLAITVTPATLPTFTAVAAICNGGVAPVLPTTSTNGITGTWAPVVSNVATGTYTFTPTAGQCATTTTLIVTVNPNVAPSVTCGVSTATSVSFNWGALAGATGYSVTYTINGGAVNNIGAIGNVTTYSVTGLTTGDNVTITVTPTGTGCFTSGTVSCIAVACIPQTIILSSAAGTNAQTVCINTAITNITYTIGGSATGAGVTGLPVGVAGTYSAGVFTISGTPTGSGTFNYTVTTTGGCAAAASANGTITVTALITPTFAPIPGFCSGAVAPLLPATSTNGITGTWSPATINNTTTGTYTFTPNAGQCASTTSVTITVTPSVTPTFTPLATICAGVLPLPVLPLLSTNGVTGTWTPAIVNNVITTLYTFTPTAGQCATTTTMTIVVNPSVTPTFTPILPFCAGTVAPTLPATSNNGISGTWLPATINNTTSGAYTFTPTPGGSCATTTILPVIVIPAPAVNLGNDTTICESAAGYVLDATIASPLATYLWQDGSTNPTFTVTTAGTYSVTVNNGICSKTDAIDIAVDPLPVFNILGGDVICPGQTVILSTGLTDPTLTYLWQDGSTNPTFSVSTPGLYSVEVTNNCGPTTRSFTVKNGICKIFMPTAFTPNNDNVNDMYKAGGGEFVAKFNMQLFNRWGQRVFVSNSVNKGWDGKLGGTAQPSGTYIYYVVYTDPITTKEITLKGTLVLIR
jgi:gliding motility-associated-like protein